MKYIYKSLEFSKQSIGLLVLFICINLFPFTYSMIFGDDKNENISFRILSIFLNLISFFFISGAYSLIWKRLNKEHINLISIFSECKKYFSSVFAIYIAMMIFLIISIFLLSYILSGLFNISIFTNTDYISFEFSIIIAISFFLISTIYCYALPYLYVRKLSSKRAFVNSPKILLKYKNESIPIILLSFSMMLVIIFQLNNSGYSWHLRTLGALSIQYIHFLVFVVTCQILDEIDISDFENVPTQNRKII